MQRTAETELLDSPLSNSVSPTELAENLADIARLNRLMGTTRLLCHSAIALVPPGINACTVLDLGTGAADWPDAFVQFVGQRLPGLRVKIIAADLQPSILRTARQQYSTMHLLGADGTCLPFCSDSIDVIVCAQTFHHLAPEQAVGLLREVARVSRFGFVLFDLTRSGLAVPALKLLTRFVSRNRLTRHDGPLSVRRAYRPEEVLALIAAAGLNRTSFDIRHIRPFRWQGIYRHGP